MKRTRVQGVVPFTVALVSELQGDIENVSISNLPPIFVIISDTEKLKMFFNRKFYVKFIFFRFFLENIVFKIETKHTFFSFALFLVVLCKTIEFETP